MISFGDEFDALFEECEIHESDFQYIIESAGFDMKKTFRSDYVKKNERFKKRS